MLLVALASLALAADPTLPGDFTCPEKGGPAWREVKTAHLSVLTDLDGSDAAELASDVERMYETVRHALFRQPPDVGAIRVVAPRSAAELNLFMPQGAGAWYVPLPDGPTILMPGDRANLQRLVAAHEVTHHVLGRVFRRQPAWFSEGLAGYMESVSSLVTPTVGGQVRYLYKQVHPFRGGAGRLLRASRISTTRDYAVAWALVHFLLNRHGPAFAELQRRFARGEEPAEAWGQVFPQWNPRSKAAMASLDGEVARYLHVGQFSSRQVQVPPPAPATERKLGAAEVHDLRLSLPWPNRGVKVEEAARRAEAEEALGHDPAGVAALTALAALEPARARELADRATGGHPEDPRAWILLGLSLPEADRQAGLEAFQRAVRAGPENPLALHALAVELLTAGRIDEALPVAQRALGLAPATATYLDTVAGVLEKAGRCPEALPVQRRALEVLPERASGVEVARLLSRLDRLVKACGPKDDEPEPEPSPPAEGGPVTG